jgi:hypothetical protein
MSNEIVDKFTTPVGRLVQGSAGEAQVVTDYNTKQPELDDQGQLQHEYYIGVAFPKEGTTHWGQTEWGQKIWAIGHGAYPAGQAGSQLMAWKVTDGDSQVPNKVNKKPCDQEGFPGHWVMSCKTQYAPTTWNRDGTQRIAASEFYRGCYVQIHVVVKGGKSIEQPSVFLNHNLIALAGHGQEISGGIDVGEAGFGAAALPAGASATPVAQLNTANIPQQPVMQPPGVQQPVMQPPGVQQPVMQPPGTPVMQPPGTPVMQPPGTPVMAPPEVSYQTADGKVWTHAQLIAGGITEAQIATLPQVAASAPAIPGVQPHAQILTPPA